MTIPLVPAQGLFTAKLPIFAEKTVAAGLMTAYLLGFMASVKEP
jgi:hypothetical protein